MRRSRFFLYVMIVSITTGARIDPRDCGQGDNPRIKWVRDNPRTESDGAHSLHDKYRQVDLHHCHPGRMQRCYAAVSEAAPCAAGYTGDRAMGVKLGRLPRRALRFAGRSASEDLEV